jgi:hypothetical protein
MSFGCTSIIGVDPRLQFISAEHAVWLRDGPFAMHPLGLDWVEPGTLRGQQARHDPHALAGLLDGAVVQAKPVAHLLALVPGSIVPDQQQAAHALRCQALARPTQKVNRDCAERPPRDKAQQHLVRMLGATPEKQPITRQRLGLQVLLGTLQFLEPDLVIAFHPAMLVNLGQAAPPDLVSKAERPGWVVAGQADQPVAPFFLEA